MLIKNTTINKYAIGTIHFSSSSEYKFFKWCAKYVQKKYWAISIFPFKTVIYLHYLATAVHNQLKGTWQWWEAWDWTSYNW